MFQKLLWILAFVAILGIIRWLFGAMGLNEGIDVKNQQQLLNAAGFFIAGLVLLGGFTATAFYKAFSK